MEEPASEQVNGRASVLPAGTTTFLSVAPRQAGSGCRAFESAAEAVQAAVRTRADQSETNPLAIAIHTGATWLDADGRHTGPAMRTCERLCQIANPGQTLLSAQAVAAIGESPPAGRSPRDSEPRDWEPRDWELRDWGLHRLRDLSAPIRVYGLCSADGPIDDRSPRSLEGVPNNLPLQLTTFVGRATEVDAIGRLLIDHRLVTVIGAGGGGKTRLAAQAAAETAERWPAGVWWVDLAAVTDPTRVAEVVAATLGVLIEPVLGPERSVTRHLRDKNVLLCLDNCEQVLDAVAELSDVLLRECPEVTLLATSREPLGLAPEMAWRLPPLTEEEAVTLFVERGALVRPWLTLDVPTEAAVRTMCGRLDGMPLALELAAGWLRTLTPQQIESGLDDRFALLIRGPRGGVSRHRTLEISIDWSHRLLDQVDQVVFRRLAVFAGGFTMDSAVSVCVTEDEDIPVLEVVGRLIDKSLIVADFRDEFTDDFTDDGGATRYRMLETIREYAGARLREADEVEATRESHLDHFLAFAETAAADPDRWRTRLQTSYDNLRTALEWGLAADDPHRGRRLAAALGWLWSVHRHGRDGTEFLRHAIARSPDDRSMVQARLLAGLVLVADANPGDLGYDVLGRALEIATEHGDERLRGLCFVLAGLGASYTNLDSAWNYALDARRSAELAGDDFVRHAGQALQGVVLYLRDQHEQAQPLLAGAVDALVDRQPGVAARTLVYQAHGALYTGDLAQARELAERAVRIAEPLSDYVTVGTPTSTLAMIHGFAGDVDGGLRLMAPLSRLAGDNDANVLTSWLGRIMGGLHLWRGEADEAVWWFERGGWSSVHAGTSVEARGGAWFAAALGQLGRYDEAHSVLDKALGLAEGLGMPRVHADVLEQRARLASAEHVDRAVDLHHRALAIRIEHGLRTFYVDSLDALAELMIRTGRCAEAARLIAATDKARGAIGYPRSIAGQPSHDRAVAELRAVLGDDQFTEAWRAGSELSLDQAVAYARRTRGSRDRPATGWDSLTPVELDVVRLIVDGLNNPEIGTRLFMSRGTVKTHLSHIYGKLGVANRTELAALATTRLGEN